MKEKELYDLLMRTNFQVVIYEDKEFVGFPVAYGSGFFILYQGKIFFITADHNINYTDYERGERIFKDSFVGVLNNIDCKEEELYTNISTIEGFYCSELNGELFDVAISLVDINRFQEKFLTNDMICNTSGDVIVTSIGGEKRIYDLKHIIEPNPDDVYFIYGKIKPTEKFATLSFSSTLKENLKYISQSGMYLLLNTEHEITDSLDWQGLSGSPIFNQDGLCIGILSSVIEGTKSIFVKPFSLITPLLDTIIFQEDNLKIE